MIVALLLYLFVFAGSIQATSNSVVIVNQVRGTECCDKGDISLLKMQLDTTTGLGMPATYALRYDALVNPEITKLMQVYYKNYQGLINPGAFLEITPALAKSAGVLYTAHERDWYKTAHVYNPGYSTDDRMAIIDTYMTAYHKVFSEYPAMTVGWFMDTYSLNYLHQKYGVLVHELTREQWGTDSYTLSGGPTHYPYVSSDKWSFLPGSGGITIIRQTITDPTYNYGDSSSSYTSQPNDYGRNKDFSYFSTLISTTLSQPGGQSGFAIIGLENSMDIKYQEEYVLQLEHLKDNYQNIVFPSPKQIVDQANKEKVTIYASDNVYTITTSNYQMRLLTLDQKVMFTDIRLYDQNIVDPYIKERVLNSGYYIAPYLIDGSRWFQFKSSWINEVFRPKFNEGYGSKNDTLTLPSHLSLPDIKKSNNIEVVKDSDSYVLKYLSSKNKQISLRFSDKSLVTEGISINEFSYKNLSGGMVPVKESVTQNEYHLTWFNKDSSVMSLDGICKENICTFSHDIDPLKFETAKLSEAFLLFPTRIEDQDTSGTLLYPSSKYILFGRSPARIVVLPRNKNGIPVGLPSVVQFDDGGLESISDPVYLQGQEAQFYDFEASKPGKYTVKVIVPGLSSKDMEFIFAMDCRKNIKECLVKPSELYSFARAILAGKMQKLKN